MTKRVNFLPSERIDVPDMVAGTTGVAVGTMQQILDDLVIAKFPRIASGFRVEIANQGSSPGEITVWNGVAIDRSGELFTNEDEESTQRSITFGADGTYFVEVEFTTSPSDSDARAFWDPTFDNGTDPSGDPKLPGREIFQTVSTRLSPDWQIVNPVSTTGFALTTTPNSPRVPVAVITVSAGVITGATTFPARSCLGQVALVGATKLYVLDSRLMPDAFSATVDAEAVSISANDRTNSILTLSGPLAFQHLAGARVVRTGGSLNQFLTTRALAPLPSSGTQDARPGLFQGDEERGFALAQDPNSASARSDSQMQALKDQIDFLAAQLREVRFGAERSTEIGQLAPPTSFPTPPRYFDKSGGLQGARYATVSVGDGTTCWGDFNVAQLGTADAAIAAAVAALPTAGGTIFIKGKSTPYDLSAGVLIDGRTVTIMGERGRTTIRATGSVGALRLHDCTLGLRDIIVARQSTADAVAAITTTTGGAMTTFEAYNSTIQGIAGTAYLKGIFENCQINEITGGSGNGFAISARVVDCTFISCSMSTTSDNSGVRCMNIQGLGSKNISLYACHLTMAGVTPVAIVEFNGSNDGGGFYAENCVFVGGASTTVQDALLVGTGTGFGNINLKNCRSSGLGAGGLLNVTAGSQINVESCTIAIPNVANAYGAIFKTGVTNVSFKDCTFNQGAGGNLDTYGIITQGSCSDFSVERCTFISCAYGIDVTIMAGLRVRDCHSYQAGGCGRVFLWVVTTLSDLTMSGCELTGFQDATGGILSGVRLTADSTHIDITACTFHDIGGVGIAAESHGVLIAETGATIGRNTNISGCRFRNINSTGGAHGIRCAVTSGAYQGLSVVNNQFLSIGALAGSGAFAVRAEIIDVFNMHGNGINTVGSTGNSTPGYGLYVETTIDDSQITGNTIANLAAVSFFFVFTGAGILLGTSVRFVTIANNTILVSGNVLAGIVMNPNNDTSSIDDITITGNVIGGQTNGDMLVGVSIALVDNTAKGQSRFVVSGNTMRGFSLYGINIISSTGVTELACCIAINGNVLETGASAVQAAIRVVQGKVVTVTGNNVDLYDATNTAKRALYLDSCEQTNTTGNYFSVGNCTVDGFVFLTLCYFNGVYSNTIFVNAPTSAFRGLRIDTMVDTHVIGNNVRSNGGLVGLSTNMAGAAISTCRDIGNTNTGTAPSSLINTSPNWWQL